MTGSGDDTIASGSGNDTVIAGTTIIGGDGAGDDSYDGGSGFDTIKYTSATDDILDLSKGIAVKNGGDKADGSDKLVNVEKVIAGHHDDSLIGNNKTISLMARKAMILSMAGKA